jgi:Family of unknown function (DUF6932)
LAEVLARFGSGSDARREATVVLQRIHQLAAATGKLRRFVIFGSYVTVKAEPRDVDVVLVMTDDFSLDACDEQTRVLFDHQRAEDEIGASIFWLSRTSFFVARWRTFCLGGGPNAT